MSDDHGAREPVVTEPTDAVPARPQPDVHVRRNESGGRYEISVDGEIAGYSEYRLEPGRIIIITHTQVLRAYSGRGLGTTLVGRMLADARDRGERIVPKCPFVQEYLKSNHEYDDIIDRA